MIEVFKMINEYAPPIVNNFFIFRDNTHNLRHFQIIFNENKKAERYGSEAISYRTLSSGKIFQRNTNSQIL